MTEIQTLPGGARLVLENMPQVRSAAVGFWVGSGSRHENSGESGISHAMEHMVFKGSERRSAADVAIDMDAIGGQVNAFTTKECTCFYAHALDEHLHQALDILGDIFFSPKLDSGDWEMERGVICEEIGMYEDTPEDLVSEQLFERCFKGCSLARPILGTPGSLNRISAKKLRLFHKNNYHPGNMVISLAGCFDQSHIDHLARLCQEVPLPDYDTKITDKSEYKSSFVVRQKDIEQNHLCIAFPSLSYKSPDRFAVQVLSTIFGGGMSSRLFQSVREKSGLCYSVYSFSATHEDTGVLGVYTALSPDTEEAALRLICDEISLLLRGGLSSQEVERARAQAKSNVIMSLESTRARMQHNGRGLLMMGKILTADQIIAEYDAVSVERVDRLANEIFDFNRLSFSAVGRVKSRTAYGRMLR